MNEWVVVIGRFRPIGDANPMGSEDKVSKRRSALLMPDGQPLCQTVALERIVPQPSVSAGQATKEFLALTDGI